MKKHIIFLILLLIFLCSITNSVLAEGSNADTIKQYAQSIKINDSPQYISVGQSYTLKATITPSNTADKTITWSSSDNKVLTIDKNGKITGKKAGTVKITVKTSNGKTDSIPITVRDSKYTTDIKKVSSLSIKNNPKEMLTGDSFKLSVQISPKYVEDSTLTYSSSNKKILTVDKKGNVKAVGKGSATITVKSSNGKKATATINVKNVQIVLNKTKVNVNKGENEEITAAIKSNSNYSPKSVKWSSNSTATSTVKQNNNNKYNAVIQAKNPGNAIIIVDIDGEKASANVKVMEAGKDYSIECPIIKYDTSNNSKIKIDVSFSKNIDHWDYYTSSNKKTGSKAKWSKINTYNGNQILYSNYTDAQGKIRVYSKEGTSRDCFTAPFDYDGSKNSNISIAYSPKITCPKLTDKVDKISGANIYEISGKKTGVTKAYITINPVSNKNYQYSWYTNKEEYYNKNYGMNFVKYQLYKTFNDKLTVPMTTIDDYDRQGIILTINSWGDVRECYTNTYSNIAYASKTTINGNTDVYFEKGYSYNSNELINIIKNLPKHYTASPNIFFLTRKTYENKIKDTNSCGIAYSANMKIYINDGYECDKEYIKVAVVHELSHTMDFMYQKIYGKYLNEDQNLKNAYNSYKNNKTNGNYTYLRDYSYSNQLEFWADFNSISYLNNNNDFKYNSYRNYWKIDNNLSNIRQTELKKISDMYSKKISDWNKYKNMYR